MNFLKKMASWFATIVAIVLGLGLAANMFLPGMPATRHFNMAVDRFLERVLTDQRFLGMLVVVVVLVIIINKLGGGGAHHSK